MTQYMPMLLVNVNDLVQANVGWQCEIQLARTAYLIQAFNNVRV
jgi:hypothetical protein